MTWRHLRRSLDYELERALDGAAAVPDALVVLRTIQAWLRGILERVEPALRQRWQLDELAELDLAVYPLDRAMLGPAEALSRLRSHEPRKANDFFGTVSQVLWDGITVELDLVCPHCGGGDGGLQCFVEVGSRTPVLECPTCGWTQLPSGIPSGGGARLRRPTAVEFAATDWTVA